MVTYRLLDSLGYPGYRVGTDGSVWTCVKMKGRGKGSGVKGVFPTLSSNWIRVGGWDPHKDRKIERGYQCVQLTRYNATGHGRHRIYLIHRIVLLAFRGPCPPGMQCRHLNGKHGDNRLCNLKWGTAKENGNDKRKHGTALTGSKNPSAKTNARTVEKIRKLYISTRHIVQGHGKWTAEKLSHRFGISKSQVLRIVNGKSWKKDSESGFDLPRDSDTIG